MPTLEKRRRGRPPTNREKLGITLPADLADGLRMEADRRGMLISKLIQCSVEDYIAPKRVMVVHVGERTFMLNAPLMDAAQRAVVGEIAEQLLREHRLRKTQTGMNGGVFIGAFISRVKDRTGLVLSGADIDYELTVIDGVKRGTGTAAGSRQPEEGKWTLQTLS